MLKHWKGSVLICKCIKTQQSWPQFFLIALEMKNSQRNFSLRMYKYIISYIGRKVKFRKPINIEFFIILVFFIKSKLKGNLFLKYENKAK